MSDAEGQSLADELGAVYSSCDVTSEEAVEGLVKRAIDELGRLDGAFNCAGILGTSR